MNKKPTQCATPAPKRVPASRPAGKTKAARTAKGKTKAKGNAKAKYLLRLYIAGDSLRSRQAIARARQLCEAELKDNYVLEVIDIYLQPIRARAGQILATPTLVKEFPSPVRRLIGTLENVTGLCVGLDVAAD